MKALAWLIFSLLQVFVLKWPILRGAHHYGRLCHLKASAFIDAHPSSWTWFYKAILIGENAQTHRELKSFLVLGLYHLIVVSGSHVAALQNWIEKMTFFLPSRLRRLMVFVGLAGFTLVNQLQPACARAMIQWLLRQWKNPHPISNADLQMVIMAICLFLEPQWAMSLSFQLSCGASLGLAMVSAQRSLWWRAIVCTTIMAPLLFSVQPCLSWLVIPANALALTVFEMLLMPVAALNTFLPMVRPATEWIFPVVFGFTNLVSQFDDPSFCLSERRPHLWGIFYLAGLYVCWRSLLPSLTRVLFWRNQRRLWPN